MGLDINSVEFLIAARKEGMELGEVLTLGRQDLNVYPAKMRTLLSKHGFPAADFAPGAPDTGFAEPAFKALGAKKIYSLDASDFEGADFVHDLNQPVPPELHARFDVVYDGGTLEHVFDFPAALKNCMEMLRPGGRFITHTCANNWCGHGFYQFSPELFFNVFCPENGFEMERVIVHRVGPYGRWYEVADPSVVRSRVAVLTFTPLQMMVRARRVKAVPLFSRIPQQSDYTSRWKEDAGAGAADAATNPYSPRRPKLARVLPGVARAWNVVVNGVRVYYTQSLFNRKCFRPVARP